MTERHEHRSGTEVQRASRVGSGAAADVGTLFDLHADAVFRYCYLALGSAADAEDAVSETFARLIRTRQRRAAPVALLGDPDRAWLFGIARNVVREQLRHRRRHPVAEPDVNTCEPLQASLEELASDREEIGRLRDALERIPREHRQLILLRFGAGLTAEETGQVLGKSPGAVRIQQMRALRTLRTHLEPAVSVPAEGP